MFYSGMDQHKRDFFITIYDDRGAIVNQERVPNTPLRIQRYFAQFPGPHKAVVESSGSWYRLADLLQPSTHSRNTTAIGSWQSSTPGLVHGSAIAPRRNAMNRNLQCCTSKLILSSEH